MASNHFGTIFKITTWGESHGKAIGVVIDGCPAGIEVSDEDINAALKRRAPGQSALTSPRREPDKAEILSGVFEGFTTGTPISILIPNDDAKASSYEPIRDLLRPGHANFTYTEKYGIFDYRGGGRASGRETACRVAAGAIALKFIQKFGIGIVAFLKQVGECEANTSSLSFLQIKEALSKSSLFCPDPETEKRAVQKIEEVMAAKDSIGGIVELQANLPIGLGDPVYEKLEANLAKALMGLPATKGFEIGSGFNGALMNGSCHNDLFYTNNRTVKTKTNNAGGTLGGISNGMPLIARVAFKPASSIARQQETISFNKNSAIISLPDGSRHDPCVAIRAVPVVEAMGALVIADALLLNRCAKL